MVQAGPGKNWDPTQKIKKKVGEVAQVVEHLFSKHEAVQTPVLPKTTKKLLSYSSEGQKSKNGMSSRLVPCEGSVPCHSMFMFTQHLQRPGSGQLSQCSVISFLPLTGVLDPRNKPHGKTAFQFIFRVQTWVMGLNKQRIGMGQKICIIKQFQSSVFQWLKVALARWGLFDNYLSTCFSRVPVNLRGAIWFPWGDYCAPGTASSYR
jgi:hypothetical protein